MAEAAISDEALVQRYRAGDEGAGRELLERLRGALGPGLRRRMPSPLRQKMGESDLLQSTYAVVFTRLAEFRDLGLGSFRAWAASVLRNKLADAMRRYQGTRKRDPSLERSLAVQSERSTPKARGESPSRAAAGAEQRERLRAAIERLAPDHRTVVVLLHEREFSLNQAAVVMERSPDAVRKLYARAIGRLSELLRLEESP